MQLALVDVGLASFESRQVPSAGVVRALTINQRSWTRTWCTAAEERWSS